MHIEAVDERTSSWEDSPRFLVYRYHREHPATSWSVSTHDVTDTDVLGVIAWAREQAGADGLFAVALVVDDPTQIAGQQRGLVWLLGQDVPNASDPGEYEQQVLAGMYARREEFRATCGRPGPG